MPALLQIDTEDPVAKLKGMVEIVCNIPSARQRLIVNGKVLDGNSTVGACGVADNDVVFAEPTPDNSAQDAVRTGQDGAALHPQAFIDLCRSKSAVMQQLKQWCPQAAKAALNNNVEEFQAALKQVRPLLPSINVHARTVLSNLGA